jgi:hypothetical protein
MGRYRIPSGGLEWDGGQVGDVLYIEASVDGRPVLTRLAIPSDWEDQEDAGTPYLLGITAGLPAWRTVTTEVVSTGFGNGFGNDFGGPI